MGTNYYLHNKPCGHCGRNDEPLHIGKSSAGWVFALRVYPAEVAGFPREPNKWGLIIDDLDDWIPLFELHEIRDEYDRVVSAADMQEIIASRPPFNGKELRRNPIEHMRVLGPGAGTWDRHIGEFS